MISLNYRDPRPMYEQIKDSFVKLILSGGIGAEERLPSVRELASHLAINPNTIQRAYRELEQEGYIYTVAGKGSFASQDREAQSMKVKQLLDEFDALAQRLISYGVDIESLISRLRKGEEEQ